MKTDNKDISKQARELLAKQIEEEQEKITKKYKLNEPERLDVYKLKKLTKFLSPQWIKTKWAKWTKPAKLVLIRMQLYSGDFITRLVAEKDGGFRYDGKIYIFDNLNKSYDRDFKYWVYTYHEGCVMPIKLDIDVEAIRDGMQVIGSEVETVINPRVLSSFVDGKVLEQMFSGVSVSGLLNKLFIVQVLTLVAVIGLILLWVKQMGYI